MKDEISVDDAKDLHGIYSNHECMPNGELRFRLLGHDSGYIRTVSSDKGAWQLAHYHKQLVETYIVECGWMGFADLVDGRVRIRIISQGSLVASKPNEVHNVYLPGNTTIHTVKTGGNTQGDWEGCPNLTSLTERLTERDIVVMAEKNTEVDDNTKLKSLMDHYINLDRLIWSVPTFFASGAAIVIGFITSVSTKSLQNEVSPVVMFSVFSFASLLFFLSFYSIFRMSFWHQMAGAEIFKLAKYEYFNKRNDQQKNRRWLSAHTVFMFVFVVLSCLCLFVAIYSLYDHESVKSAFLKPKLR